MEKKVENAEQSAKSTRPPIEKGKMQSKPKTGKIIRVVPMGSRKYMSCHKEAQVTEYPNLKR